MEELELNRDTLNVLSDEVLKEIKSHLKAETKRVIKDIDSILNERGEK